MSCVSDLAYAIAYALAQALIFLYFSQDPVLSLAIFILDAISAYGLLTLARFILGLIRT